MNKLGIQRAAASAATSGASAQRSLTGFLQSLDVLAASHAARAKDINDSLSNLATENRDLLDNSTLQAVSDFVQANQRMRSRFNSLVDSIQLCDLRNEARSVPPAIATAIPNGTPVSKQRVSVHDRLDAMLGNREAAAADDLEANRRNSPRRPYPFLQHIAEYVPGQVLESSQFREVRCHDLSASGFSYWAAQSPGQSTLIVRFGSAPDLTYLTAQVMHVTERNRSPQRRYLVGCKFLERVSISPTTDQEPLVNQGAQP